MMILVVNFSVDSHLWLKVKEGLNRDVALKVRKGSDYSPFSLSWLGYVANASWNYILSGELYGSGVVTDSIFDIGTVDTVGACYKPGSEVAFLVSVGTSDSGAINDTFFMLFDGTLYDEGGVMVAKYNPSFGDNWEAWDTCLIPLNTRMSTGDIDGDGAVDTFWVGSSSMWVIDVTPSIFTTAVSPLRIGVWASSLVGLGVDSIIIMEYDRHVFQIGNGKLETHTDSVRYQYYMGSMVAIDTTLPNIYHKTRPAGAVSERSSLKRPLFTLLKGRVEVSHPSDYTLSVYSSSGRLIERFHGKGESTYPLPEGKGIYFIVLRSKGLSIVRSYVK